MSSPKFVSSDSSAAVSWNSKVHWWTAGIIVLTVLVYMPGLDGPFLFDDPPNILIPFQAWLDGRTGWQEMVLGNHSGMLGRPLAMLSFLANASTTGLSAVAFKATNLAIHLLCGMLIYTLLANLLARDPKLSNQAKTLALLVTSIWLLHPMQVSTVLYVVQRMAQLSALFTLLALLAYVNGRTAVEQGYTRRAAGLLFAAFPAATLAAILCKENGALAPLMCAVIEFGYFRPANGMRRPGLAKAFFSMFLLIPGALAVSLFAWKPTLFLGGYEGRLFTLGERLISELRALFQYIGALLLPRGPSLGLYTDDFPISHGLLDPPTTLASIIGLVALIALAFKLRKTVPVAFTGIGLFLAGHAMESTIFPLELYFEHRNYLPAFGLFLAVLGGFSEIRHRIQTGRDIQRSETLFKLGLGAFVLLLALATLARANVWNSWPALAEQGVTHHPDSMRARLDQISLLLAQTKNEEALVAYRQLASISNPAAVNVSAMGTVYLQCRLHEKTSSQDVESIRRIVGKKLQLPELMSAENLANQLMRKDCDGLSKLELAKILRSAADLAAQPAQLTQIWRTRFTSARLFLDSNATQLAQEQAALAWMSGSADPAVGVFLANIYYLLGERGSARIIVGDVKHRMKSWDTRTKKLLADLTINFERS